MPYLDPVLTFWCLATLQIVALASACLARIAEGSLREAHCQWICMVCLALAGLGTMFSLAMGPTSCVFSGAVLAVTILTATWDVGAAVL